MVLPILSAHRRTRAQIQGASKPGVQPSQLRSNTSESNRDVGKPFPISTKRDLVCLFPSTCWRCRHPIALLGSRLPWRLSSMAKRTCHSSRNTFAVLYALYWICWHFLWSWHGRRKRSQKLHPLWGPQSGWPNRFGLRRHCQLQLVFCRIGSR